MTKASFKLFGKEGSHLHLSFIVLSHEGIEPRSHLSACGHAQAGEGHPGETPVFVREPCGLFHGARQRKELCPAG